MRLSGIEREIRSLYCPFVLFQHDPKYQLNQANPDLRLSLSNPTQPVYFSATWVMWHDTATATAIVHLRLATPAAFSTPFHGWPHLPRVAIRFRLFIWLQMANREWPRGRAARWSDGLKTGIWRDSISFGVSNCRQETWPWTLSSWSISRTPGGFYRPRQSATSAPKILLGCLCQVHSDRRCRVQQLVKYLPRPLQRRSVCSGSVLSVGLL